MRKFSVCLAVLLGIMVIASLSTAQMPGAGGEEAVDIYMFPTEEETTDEEADMEGLATEEDEADEASEITIAPAQGSVTLQPNQGPVGTNVTANGRGWPVGALVHAFFNLQQVTVAPKTVGRDGSFTLNFCVPNLRPGIYPTFFTISTQGGMFSGPIFTITAGHVNCQAETCRPAFFIGIRGSGERDTNGSLGDTVGAFYNKFKVKYGATNVDFHGVPYPAISVPDFAASRNRSELSNKLRTFGASVATGVRKLNDFLVGQHATCPDQQFVIVAYSQGAWVAGEGPGST